jgi:hypothetical protein
MKSATTDKIYTSPVRKLVRFFEKSRDQWKAKCRAAKASLKRLKRRVRVLEESRARWKQRAQELAAQLHQQEAEARQLQAELATRPQNESPQAASLGGLNDFALIPRYHQYSVGHVKLYLDLVLADAISVRGASRATQTMKTAFQLPLAVPEWHTGRLWLQRLGYYKLTRPKEQANDWIWIADHTVQIGAEKCFVILGLRQRDLPPVGRCLRHQDVELLALLPVAKSNQAVVQGQLEATVAKTGVPRLIVGDHGSDLKAGVENFCQEHPETSFIYDIKHKTAAVLKRELAHDATWLEFTRLATHTKNCLQQTALAHLVPPNQRTKARYMNIDVLVQWGQDVLALLDSRQPAAAAQCPGQQLQAKLGWITRFRQPLAEWGELLQLTSGTADFVRRQGLYGKVHLQLAAQLQELAHTARTQRVRTELVAFVAQESAKAHAGERLLGSSEVIESVLGKLKHLEQDQATSGFTGLLLSLGAMVSATTADVILQALESVPTQEVLDWCKETLGPSVQAKRRRALTAHRKAEQKWEQVLAPV